MEYTTNGTPTVRDRHGNQIRLERSVQTVFLSNRDRTADLLDVDEANEEDSDEVLRPESASYNYRDRKTVSVRQTSLRWLTVHSSYLIGESSSAQS